MLTKTSEQQSLSNDERTSVGGAVPWVEKPGHTADIGRNALSFFFCSSLLTILCGVAYVVLTRLEFVKYHLRLQRYKQIFVTNKVTVKILVFAAT